MRTLIIACILVSAPLIVVLAVWLAPLFNGLYRGGR